MYTQYYLWVKGLDACFILFRPVCVYVFVWCSFFFFLWGETLTIV